MPRLLAPVLMVSALVLGGSAVVHAGEAPPKDPTARAEWYSQRAEVAFEAGKFADAIKLYLDAYEAAPSASILYNVAFIYDRKLKDPELAIDYYERVARAQDADKALSDKARARAAALRAELAKPPDKPPPDKPPPDKPPPDKPPDIPPDDPGQGGAFPIGPVVTIAAGGAVFVTGVAFAFLASGTHDDFEAATRSADKRALQSTGRTQALVADIGMAVGGAALVGGVLWLLFDRPDEATSSSVVPLGESGAVRLAPAVAPGQLGLTLGGSF